MCCLWPTGTLPTQIFIFFGTAEDYKSCCFYFSVVMVRPWEGCERRGAWGRRECWGPRDTGAAPRSDYPPASLAPCQIRVYPLIPVLQIQNQIGSGFKLGGSGKQCCRSRPGIRCFFDHLDPGSGMEKNPEPRSGMNIPDLIFEKLV